MTIIGIKLCTRTYVSLLSIPSMNFTFQKNYAAQTLCPRSIIQNLNPILLLNHIQISLIPHSTWKFGAFSLGNLAYRNSYSNLQRLSNTPANRSISLLEIPNRLAVSLIYRFFCHCIILFPYRLIKRFPNALQNLAQLV